MKKYWFIVLIALAAGCKSPGHCETYVQHHPGPGPEMAQPMHGMGPGMSPGIIYYNEASQKLAEGRRNDYLTNEQFADLMEKLMGDVRQIMVAEAKSAYPMPGHPMRRHPSHHKHHHKREHREDER